MNVKNANLLPPPPFDAWAVVDLWARRWRWMALWTVVVAIAGALLAASVWRRTFTSTAELIRYEPSAVDDSYHPRALAAPSLVVMLQAPGLLEDVGSHLKRPVTSRELAEQLEITLDRNNDVVTVTATGRSREEAIETVNKYCAAAIAYTQSIQRQEATEAGNNLNHQLEEVENEISSTRKELPSSSESAVSALTSGPTSSVEVATALQLRIQASREHLDDLLTSYTDAHPLVIEQRARLAALEAEEAKSPVPDLYGPTAAPQIAPVPVLSPAYYGRVTPEDVAMSERLRALESNRAILIVRQRAIQPFRENPPGYFRILLSAAANPTHMQRYRIQIALFSCLGAVVGLFGSAGQIVLGEFLDNRIKTRIDVRRVTGLPLLASLGDLNRMLPEDRDQWAFRAWTALQSSLSVSSDKGLVCGFISASQGDGRSTWISLLARAARTCGFRVLTIIAQPTPKQSAELGRQRDQPSGDTLHGASQESDSLPTPGYIVAQLTGEECPPVVVVPLPGWIWNLERRKQWRSAFEAWRAVDHVVIFVELPPACVAESVLLAETIPNLVWLVDASKTSAAETQVALDTLRAGSCNLVGAVLNREPTPPVRAHFGRWLGTTALLLLALLAAAPTARADYPAAPVAPPATSSVADPATRAAWQQRLTLGPGDVLTFHINGSPELTREDVPITPDGRISYLEAEDIVAAGLTVDELRERLNTELGKYRRSPQAYVTPISYRSKRYYVLGSVVKEGVYYLDHSTTVIEAVARAHGFETGLSNGDTVDATDFTRSFISRGGHRVPVDFERLFMHGDLSQNVALEPNDYLYFPASYSGEIYVLGEVGLPGPLAFDTNASALSAIVARGGFTERAWKAHVLVVRGSLDHPVAFTVDIAGALKGTSPNLALQAGDIVYVADRPWINAEELLDHAATAFVASAVVTWVGLNVGPNIISRPSP
jgi:protein involved in polysaccharide export with SLBB domain/capsular polysaccharide biosynthesis protein